MLYKYLFYSVSYWVKKYDHLWKVGDTYFVGGGMAVGIIIALTIINSLEIIGIIFFRESLLLRMSFLLYLALVLGIISTIYWGYKKRYETIYEEVRNMETSKKKKYKILNIIHIFLVLTSYFILGDLVRGINGGDVPSYASFLITKLHLK